jgi:hypothetical protein
VLRPTARPTSRRRKAAASVPVSPPTGNAWRGSPRERASTRDWRSDRRCDPSGRRPRRV